MDAVFFTSSKIGVCNAGKKGVGVFAAQNIPKGELIERVPVLLIPAKFNHDILNVDIGNYMFEWWNNDMALALGYGSLYNHSYAPNAYYELYYKDNKIEFFALNDISQGEEILVNYNGIPDDMSEVWFTVFP